MTNSEMRQYLREFVSSNGTGVRLSKLAKEFSGFEPTYSPRGKQAKEPEAARKAAILRGVESLYDALLRAVVNEEINFSDADGVVDFGAISESFGGNFKPGLTMPDYIIALDERFFTFTQSLGPNVGGRKTTAKPQGERSPNSQRLYEALKKLEKANGASAREFLTVYRELQAPMKLPKIDD